jgi:UDP-glucose 4-epimerase
MVTGGAGFIGSHLVDRLIAEGYEVVVLDNLTSGSIKNIRSHLRDPNFKLIRVDLKEKRKLEQQLDGVDCVFHFAANPEVRVGEVDPSVHFNENLVATFNLLEAMRKSKTARTIIFASTSTVYGEASSLPTPEDYAPMIPISTYGASKLGCEALISSYVHTFGLRGLILRLANIVGPRATHGVILDFIEKLRKDTGKLEILGDGSQKKSYLHIQDCVNAIICATKAFLGVGKRVDVYNVGSTDQITVGKIAEIVVRETNIPNVKLFFTGGVDGGRGWLGDVKLMHLSVEKLMKVGWRPKYSSEEALTLATREILRDLIQTK